MLTVYISWLITWHTIMREICIRLRWARKPHFDADTVLWNFRSLSSRFHKRSAPFWLEPRETQRRSENIETISTSLVTREKERQKTKLYYRKCWERSRIELRNEFRTLHEYVCGFSFAQWIRHTCLRHISWIKNLIWPISRSNSIPLWFFCRDESSFLPVHISVFCSSTCSLLPQSRMVWRFQPQKSERMRLPHAHYAWHNWSASGCVCVSGKEMIGIHFLRGA